MKYSIILFSMLTSVAMPTLALETSATTALIGTVQNGTCAGTLSPGTVAFGDINMEDIIDGSVAEQEITLALTCDLLGQNLQVTFGSGGGGTADVGNGRIMQSGLQGVGFSLQWAPDGITYSNDENGFALFDQPIDWQNNDIVNVNSQEGRFKLKPRPIGRSGGGGAISAAVTVSLDYN